MYVNVLLACMYIYYDCAWCSQRLKEGIWTPGTEVTDNGESWSESWELNLGLPEKQPVLLTNESFLQLLS